MAISTAAFDDGDNGASKITFTPSRNPNIGVEYGSNYQGVLKNQAIGGECYTIERFGKRRTFTMTYSFLTSADQAKLQALIDYADGRKNFFFFSEDNFSTTGIKVRFDQDSFAFQEVANGATSITFSIIEQL
ncbi:MAG: hypothetical protein Tp1111SUR768151_16 [Prokaryotic dsDNA virus sp.]|nr:MAG: hypothetical protein Tp1111SUR768151_16 [Prokaryotic dsDNA virus sp.]|tara:strand:+ start:358 stop:753 length:396 start_codon:yes stop_codon:yes gene_type:complete